MEGGVAAFGLLLLAVGGVAIVAARLLERLGDEQALARVAQAGVTAQALIGRASESTLTSAQLLAEVLKRCGDNLTRENVLKQALSLKNLSLPMLVPGVTINTGPDDYLPLQQMQMMQFDGEKWALTGKLIDN